MKVIDGVLSAAQTLNTYFYEACKVDGLTVQQARVVCAVHGHPGLSQTDLVAATGIDRSTTADIVRRMARKGILKRVRTKEDQRVYAVTLTKAGEKLVQPALAAIAATERKLLAETPGLRALAA